MERFKKVVLLATAITLLAAGAAYAAAAPAPAEITAFLTGKSVETLMQERAHGRTFGTMANEAGKLDEFKARMLEKKKAVLNERVTAGKLTGEKADVFQRSIQERQANCDGNRPAMRGRHSGSGFGQGLGHGKGLCAGSGICNGSGQGADRGINR